MVKCGVKDRYLRKFWAEYSSRRENALDVVWIVKWSQIDTIFDSSQDVVGNQYRFGESLASVHNAVPDRVNIRDTLHFRNTGLFGRNPSDHEIKCGRQVCQWSSDHGLGLVCDACCDNRFGSDTLDDAPAQPLIGFLLNAF
jgi:hypothetical protein